MNKDFEGQENPDKISEIGHNVIENNKTSVENPNHNSVADNPILCAKCMYELYMSKGIMPQTNPPNNNGSKPRPHSLTRIGKGILY